MDEQKADIDKIIESIIKAKIFNQAEQKILADLFEKEGVSEVFFQKVKEIFEAAVKKAAQKNQPIIASFDERTELAEREMREQNTDRLTGLKNKLSQIPDDDFAQRGRLLNEHSQMVLAQYGALEQKIRDIAAEILLEQIKTSE